MTYRLYLAPNSYAMTVHALLKELGLSHELVWVELFQTTPDPAFLKVSPHARVPALEGNGTVIFETGAIALYLAERHGDGAFLIPPGDPDRARFLQWLHYLASTLQPDVMIQFHPELYVDGETQRARFQAASMARLAKVLDVLDEALEHGPFFLGERITVLDHLLALQAVWPEIYPGTAGDYNNIARHLRTMMSRPAVRKTLDIHIAKKRELGHVMPLALPL